MFAWAGADGSFSEVVAIATLTGWGLKGFGTWKFGRGSVLVGLFCAYSAWMVISALGAADGTVAFDALREHFKHLIMFIVAATLADSPRRVAQLAWVIAGSAGYLSLEMNLQYLGGFNEIQQLGYGGMDNNSIAVSLVTCLGPALFLGLRSRALWEKGFAFAAAALIAHTVMLTFSRGGMLAMIVAGVAAFIAIPKRPRYLVPVALAIALGLRLAGPELRDRFATAFAEDEERDYSAQSRVELWMDCVKVMQKYPVLGVGPDHFPLIAGEFGWPRGKEAHSLWLQIGAEIGIPGMSLLVLFYGFALWRLWRLARARTGETALWSRDTAGMVLTSLAGFVVAAQFVTMEGLETPLYIMVLAIGTLRSVAVSGERAKTLTVVGFRQLDTPPAEPVPVRFRHRASVGRTAGV
jgi:O-antigen ligase